MAKRRIGLTTNAEKHLDTLVASFRRNLRDVASSIAEHGQLEAGQPATRHLRQLLGGQFGGIPWMLQPLPGGTIYRQTATRALTSGSTGATCWPSTWGATNEETEAGVMSVAVFHEGEGAWLSAGS